jgi:phage I-like protein
MKNTVQLKPYRISNGAAVLKELPRRIKLADWGVNASVNGPVVVNDVTARLLPMNQAKLGFDRVALDYEHNTVPGTPAFKAETEPRKVAAYGIPLVIAGEGLFLDDLQYTPSGREFAREYIDLSPTPLQADGGVVTFLHSAALCRQGAIEGLSFFSVMMDEAPVEDGMQIVDNPQEEALLMDKIMALLKKALGLKEDADENAVIDGLKAFSAAGAKLSDLEAKLAPVFAMIAPDGKLTTFSATLEGLTAQVAVIKPEDLQGKLVAMTADLDQIRKDLVCYHARLEGKVVPMTAEQIKATPLATLVEMVAKIAPTVPVDRLTPHGATPPDAAHGCYTEEQAKVARACGLDPEKVNWK